MCPTSCDAEKFPLLDQVLKIDVDEAVIDTLIDSLCKVVRVVEPTKEQNEEEPIMPLNEFIANITARSRCTMSVVLVVFIFLGRLRNIVKDKHSPGKPSSRYRIIFALIMVAHKVYNDSSMVGKHWAEVSDLFASSEVLAMERELLALLNFDLNVNTEEVWSAATRFMIPPFIESTSMVSKRDEVLLDDVFVPAILEAPNNAILQQAAFLSTFDIHSLSSSPCSSCNSVTSPLLQAEPIPSFLDSPLPAPTSPSTTTYRRLSGSSALTHHVNCPSCLPHVRSISTLPNTRFSARTKSIVRELRPYPLLVPSARLVKKRCVSSVHLFHLSEFHPYSVLSRPSPVHSGSECSSANASLTSSPSSIAPIACPQSPVGRYTRKRATMHSVRRYSPAVVNSSSMGVVDMRRVIRQGPTPV